VQVRRGDPLEFICAVPHTVRTGPGERVGGVVDEPDPKPQVAADSQQWLVVMPQITTSSMCSCCSQFCRSGDPWKLELTLLSTSRSAAPSMPSLNACPGCAGFSGDRAFCELCRTSTTGLESPRHRSSRLRMFCSQSGLLRMPQKSASSNPCWTSTTISAAR